MKNINLRLLLSVFFVISIIIFPSIVNNGVLFNGKGEKSKKVELYMENRYQTSNIIQDIFIDNDFAYIAKGSGGLEIINASELPYIRRSVTFQQNEADVVDVEVHNNIAYVLQSGTSYPPYNDTLDLYDVTIPQEPTRIGGFLIDCLDDVGELFVSGNMAYVTTGEKVVFIDVSDPSNPEKAGEFDYDDPHFVYPAVTAIDNTAYVRDENEGLLILDIRNPASPVQVGYYGISNLALSMVVEDDIMYVSMWNGFEAINVSTPLTPTKIGKFNLEEKTRANYIAVKDDIAFITFWTYEYWDLYTGPQGFVDSGIIAVDLTKQDNLIEIGKYVGLSFASKIVAYNDLLYVVDDHDLCVFRIETSEIDIGEETSFSWDNLWPSIELIIKILAIPSIILSSITFYRYRKKKKEKDRQNERFHFYLERIDNMYNRNNINMNILKEEFGTIREDIKTELSKNEITEDHYMILERRVDEYLLKGPHKEKEEIAANHDSIKEDKGIGKDVQGEDVVEHEVDRESEEIIEEDIRNDKSA